MMQLMIPQTGSFVAIGVLLFGLAAAAGQIPAPDDVAAMPDDAETTSSGLASKVIQAGTGSAHPSATDEVTVHYTGWLTNGQAFDSSVANGAPATFPLNRVIKGWTEGVQLMVVGEKRRFWIPSELGYGEKGAAGGAIPPDANLVFDIELLGLR
jgi:peptidylprolyl isomerase